ncbi:hypothetical protein HG530_014237 [Fusarium avenaceum]|nr:hypothetical protein HG530_014237 [Fusarium avenaceum]
MSRHQRAVGLDHLPEPLGHEVDPHVDPFEVEGCPRIFDHLLKRLVLPVLGRLHGPLLAVWPEAVERTQIRAVAAIEVVAKAVLVFPLLDLVHLACSAVGKRFAVLFENEALRPGAGEPRLDGLFEDMVLVLLHVHYTCGVWTCRVFVEDCIALETISNCHPSMSFPQVAWPVSLRSLPALFAELLSRTGNQTHLSIKTKAKVKLNAEANSSPILCLGVRLEHAPGILNSLLPGFLVHPGSRTRQASSISQGTHGSVQRPGININLNASLLSQSMPVQINIDISIVPQNLLHLLLIVLGYFEWSPARLLPLGIIALRRGDAERGITLRTRQVKVPKDG